MTQRDADLAIRMLAAASELLDGIQAGMTRRGFDDVRPAHGFAFARIAAGDASVLDIAEHLGVTKQGASQLVEQLVQRGYVARVADGADARRRVLALTPRGSACTEAAEASAADVVGQWRTEIGAGGVRELYALLARMHLAGPVRPAW